jgi:hypothetical protein
MKAGDEFDGEIDSDQTDLDGRQAPQESLRTRKLTVHLSEAMFERLKAVIDRPGVGKSMVVETALELFLDPAPSIEDHFHEHFGLINSRLESLQSEIRIVAETAALHARYHLTVTPPMPQFLQREACALGRDRFNELAEQVDRRVRSSRPLMQETIDRLADRRTPQVELDDVLPAAFHEPSVNTVLQPDLGIDLDQPIAAVREDGSNPNFRYGPFAFC